MLRETMSRGMCGLASPSRTRERGEKGDGGKGGVEEGERVKERALGRLPQPSILRLIRNAAAFAAASPTLFFNEWKNAARLKRNESDWLRSDGGEVRLGLP